MEDKNYQTASFTIPMSPVPKGRPRTVIRNGIPIVYTPKATRNAEATMWRAIRGQWKSPVITSAIRLTVFFWMPIPASWSEKKKREALYTPHVSKPDLDNLIKTLDSLNKLLWHDDSQIYSIEAHKQYSDTPRIELILEW